MSLDQRGLTLVEVLLAGAIITVGLTAVMGGLQYAVDAVEVGRRDTVALFLAEQRLEQVKAMALTNFPAVTAANFPAEDPVAGYPQYRRIVDVTPGPVGLLHAVRVQVTVAYRPVAAAAPSPSRTVTLATVVSRRL
jgi:Tfp pilus assembly protein PilV